MDMPTHTLFTCCKDLDGHFKLATFDVDMVVLVTALVKGGR